MSSLADLSDFNKNITGSAPLNFEKDVSLFNTSIDCPQNGAIPGFKGSAGVDLNGKVNGNVDYGVAIAGTIVPPYIDEFGIFVNLDTTVTGTLGIDATLTVSVSRNAYGYPHLLTGTSRALSVRVLSLSSRLVSRASTSPRSCPLAPPSRSMPRRTGRSTRT